MTLFVHPGNKSIKRKWTKDLYAILVTCGVGGDVSR